MRQFWESKKWLAFAVCVVAAILTMVLNAKYGLGIDPNVLYGLLGLNTLYILVQGKIDSKKTGGSPSKAFFESHKFVATAVGNVVPILCGLANKKWGLGIDPGMIMGLLGLNAVYVLRKGAIDAKEPDKH